MIKFKYSNDADIGPVIHLYINSKIVIFCLCHRQKNRSIAFFGLENYLCARCLGILLGIILGAVFGFFSQSISYIFIFIMVVPLIIDGLTQSFGLRASSNPLRLVTGVMFGFGMALLFFY